MTVNDDGDGVDLDDVGDDGDVDGDGGGDNNDNLGKLWQLQQSEPRQHNQSDLVWAEASTQSPSTLIDFNWSQDGNLEISAIFKRGVGGIITPNFKTSLPQYSPVPCMWETGQ